MSEWEYVKPKKRKQKQRAQPSAQRGPNGRVAQAKIDRAVYVSSTSAEDTERTDDAAELSSLVLRVTAARQALRTTSFYESCVSALRASLAAKEGRGGGALFSRAVLLGLGQFSHNQSGSGPGSMPCILQLALALELLTERALFEQTSCAITDKGISDERQHKPRAFIYDPVMTALDASLCSALGLTVMPDEGERGEDSTTLPVHLRPIPSATTLFYMPHCPYLLYNHVLWAHWAPLDLLSIVILGNSFESYNLRNLGQRSAPPRWECVKNLSKILSEQSVWQSKRTAAGQHSGGALPPCLAYLENAFNDMSVLSYNQADVLSEEGQRLLSPVRRASEEEIQAAISADLEMINSNNNINKNTRVDANSAT